MKIKERAASCGVRLKAQAVRLLQTPSVQTLPELLLGKYLFLICVAVIAYVTRPLLEAVTYSSTLPFYYTLDRTYLGLRADNFYGILSFAEGDILKTAFILRGLYIVMTVLAAVIMTIFIRRFQSKMEKLKALVITSAVVYALAAVRTEIFRLTAIPVMCMLVLLSAAYLLAYTRGKAGGAAAVLLAAAAEAIASQTILYIIPAIVITAVFRQNFRKKEPKKILAVLTAMFAAAAVTLAVTEIICRSTPSADMDTITAHLQEVYLSDPERNPDYDPLYIKYSILTFQHMTVLPEMTPLRLLTYPFQPFRLLTRNYANLYDLSVNLIFSNNLICIFYAACFLMIVTAVKATVKKQILNDSFSRMLLCIYAFSTVHMLMNYQFRSLQVLLICLTAVCCYYRFIQHTVFTVDRKKIVKLALSVIMLKYVCLSVLKDVKYVGFSLIHYLVSYQTVGFAPRALIGTLVQCLFGYHISDLQMRIFVTCSQLVMTVICLLIPIRLIKNCKTPAETKTAILISLAYVLSPAYSFIFARTNVFKLDLYLLILTFAALPIICKNRNTMLLLPVFCALAMLIHPVFAATTFPLLFILMLYRAFVSSEGHAVRNFAAALTSVGAVAAVFIWSSYLYVPKYSTPSEIQSVLDIVTDRYDFYYSRAKIYLRYIWFDINHEHIAHFRTQIEPEQLYSAVKYLIWTLPVSAMFFYALVHSAKKEKKLLPKLAFIAMGMSLFVCFVPFWSETDYGRWVAYITLTELISVLMFTVIQPAEKKWYTELSEKTLRNWLFVNIFILASLPITDAFIQTLPLFTYQV